MNPRVAGHFDLLAIEDSLDPMSFQFCFPLHLGMAACGIEPGPDWQAPENLHNPGVVAFAKKVRMFPEKKVLQAVYDEVGNEPKPVKRIPTFLEVTTNDGRTFKDYREFAKGDPWDSGTRLTDEELNEKFRVYTKKILSTKQIEALIDTIYELEKVANVRTLADLLVLER